MRRTCFKSGTYVIHSIFVCIKELLRNPEGSHLKIANVIKSLQSVAYVCGKPGSQRAMRRYPKRNEAQKR